MVQQINVKSTFHITIRIRKKLSCKLFVEKGEYTPLFIRIFYKNHEAQIAEKLRIF